MTESQIELTNQLHAGQRAAVIARSQAEYASDESARKITSEEAFVNDGLRMAGLPRLRTGELDGILAASTAGASRYAGQSGIDTLQKQSGELAEVRTMLVAVMQELGFTERDDMTPERLPAILDKIRSLASKAKAAAAIPSGGRAYGGRPIRGHLAFPPGHNQ